MAIFKCKMCGGTLEINNNETVAVCEYCGTQQTLPRLDDDRRVNLYDRANHFRRNNEYDKAMGIYEQILNEDSTDAEAYWSLVLCHYGIEYVEDPASHKRIPTVNRTQFTSIYNDDNYKSAIQHADGSQRSIYEEEAKAINEIQKGILAISQKEEPFDVFICYKETDKNGRRTPDSVLANDLYHQLIQEGFKVFFARITLEDKLGSAYEPYIFAALNSSKVMVVLGTKPEFFNAVWVKNEWSRYLSLIKGGAKKMLIPAYRDMDPYDLPEEFSHLQAQDMSKLGFMQDLIRGIKKIIKVDEPKAAVVKESVVQSYNANVSPLVKRAFLFLEDGDWENADEYCERALDADPENALAYLGKLMADLHVRKQEKLDSCAEPFDNNSHYRKVMRFGDDKLKSVLQGYIEHIKIRNENARLEAAYDEARNIMGYAKSESEYKEAADLFGKIREYRDSAALAVACLEKAEIARKEDILSAAAAEVRRAYVGIPNYEAAIKLLENISGWPPADERICEYQNKIEELKVKMEAERLDNIRREEIARKEAEIQAKRKRMVFMIALFIAGAAVVFMIVLNMVIIPNRQYNEAIALMDAGKYGEAMSTFEELNGYKDSVVKIAECKYREAVALVEAGEYEEAMSTFEELNGYKDSVVKIAECNTALQYREAVALVDAGNYVEAQNIFLSIGGYKDASERATEISEKAKIQEGFKNCKVGSYITFGKYEQDNNLANGKESISWLVLEVKDGKALVVSEYALDCQEYNTSKEGITWATCSLRQWLNSTFANDAFSDSEKDLIHTVTKSADSLKSDTNPSGAMEDQVFLLSVTEVNRYFRSEDERKCEPTAYAKDSELYVADGKCCWWLRSTSISQNIIACAYVDGCIVNRSSYTVNAVRPALYIKVGY